MENTLWSPPKGGYTHEGVTLTPTAAQELEREIMKTMYTLQLTPGRFYNGVTAWGDCRSFRAAGDAAAILRAEKLIRKTGAPRARLWAGGGTAGRPIAQWSGGLRLEEHTK